MEMFNPINCKAYLSALQGGRIVYPLAPTTSWRQTVEALDTLSEASTIYALGTVEAISDPGDYQLTFYDAEGTEVARVGVEVALGTPANETALAAAIAAAIEAEADLDDYRDAATSDGTDWAVTFLPGLGLRILLEPGDAADDLTVAHFADINLNALNERNTFPRYVTREADPFVLVTSAWPADTTITVANTGEASSEVIVDAPADAEGVGETASTTTLSVTDMVEPSWDPVATLALGDDPFPTDGALEVIVPFSPIIAPVRLP